jgi:LPS-assembly lipoprotein
MSWSRRSALVLSGAALLALAGCGFKPLYRADDGRDAVPQFAEISIAQPDDRPSQQLRNHLLDMLTPRGTPDRPRYLLEYRITESIGSVFVLRSEEITRNNLQISVSGSLRDYQSGKTLYSMTATSQASYNLTTADYANLISEKNARERALRDAAEQIRLRLGNYFDRWEAELKLKEQRQLQELQQQRQTRP